MTVAAAERPVALGKMRLSATNFRSGWLGGVALVALAICAYFNALDGAFVYDDDVAIVQNYTIRSLRPLERVLRTPSDGSAATGRPLTNLTFALNYAQGGATSRGFHVVNLAIHIGAALFLFGILRRTLTHACASTAPWLAAHAQLLALLIAALWMTHPLQTESVTYLAQRSEELMGLCLLGSLYGYVRASAAQHRRGRRAWLAFSAAICFVGMAAKEVMATAPLLILLFDRCFVAGSFGSALRHRRKYYAALAVSWLPLALLLARSGSRGGTIGFASSISPPAYLGQQLAALTHYLRLCFWPHPLVIAYGAHVAPLGLAFLMGLLLTAVGLTWTTVGLVRNTAPGFLGAWFFVILAPTSSIIPVGSEIMAEHRLYLPLAAVLVVTVAVAARLLRNWFWPLAGLALLASVLGTQARNRDYQSPLTLWSQTAAARPADAGAHNNLGVALLAANRAVEAEAEFARAVDLDPAMAGARNNLGSRRLARGQSAAAAEQFAEAVRLRPGYADARLGLAEALTRTNHPSEALAEYDLARATGAPPARVQRGRAVALLQLGRVPEALLELRAAVALEPTNAAGHLELGFGWERAGQKAAAEAEYRASLRLDPAQQDAAFDLGNLLISQGRLDEGIAALTDSLRVQPDRAEAYGNLGGALIAAGRPAEALDPLAHALQLKPDLIEAEANRGDALLSLGRYPEAIATYRALLSRHPDYALAHHNLAVALHATGDDEGARRELAAERRARAATP